MGLLISNADGLKIMVKNNETVLNTYTGKILKLDLTAKKAYVTMDFGEGHKELNQKIAPFLKMGFKEGEEFIMDSIVVEESFRKLYYLRLKRK